MPGLHFESSIDFQQMNAQLKLMEGKINDLTRSVERSGDEMQNTFNRVGTAIGAYFSVQALAGFGNELINVRGEFQQMQIALETMLGSKDKADRLMGQVVNLAAKTPFTLTQVGQATKQLLAFQFAEGEVIDTTTRLGNVAAGLSVPLDQLIRAYGQVKAKGKLMGDDMRQFTEAGVPMVAELAKVFNVTEAEVYKLVETGKVGFDDVKKVISNLTDEGGMFFNLMEKQSKSLTGMVSNLQDAWARMLNEIGQSNEGILADGISGLTNLVDNYEDVIKVVKVLIATYGAYKTAVALSTVATNGLTIAENLHYAALVIAEKAQKLLNMTSLANPYVALATALAAVVSGLYLFGSKTDEVSEGQKRIAEASKRASESFAEQKGKIDLLRETAKNQALSDKQRYDAIKQLKDLMPDYNAEISAEGKLINESTTAIENYLKQLELKIKMTAVQEEIAELWRREREELKLLAEAQEKYNEEKAQKAELDKLGYVNPGTSGAGMGGNIADESAVSKANALKEEAQKNLDATRQALQELKGEYTNAEKSLTDFFNSTKTGTVESKLRTVDVIDAEIKKLKDEQQALSDTAKKWDDFQRKIDKLTKEREGITGNKKDDKKNTAKVGVWDEKDAFEKDLQDFATYQDKRLSIIEKYSQSRQRLQEQGYDEQAAEASAQMQKELQELDKAHSKELLKYKYLYDKIEHLSINMLKDRIGKIKETLADADLTEEIQSEALRALSAAQDALISKAPLAALNSIKSRIAQVRAMIKATTDDAKKVKLEAELSELEGKRAQALNEMFSNVASRLNEATQIAGMFSEELKQAVELASSLASAFSQIASGNYVAGAIGILTAVASVSSKLNSKREQAEQQAIIDRQQESLEIISQANKLYEYQLKLLNLIKGAGVYDSLISSKNSLLDAVKAASDAIEKLDVGDGRTARWERETSGPWWDRVTRQVLKYKQYNLDSLSSLMNAAVANPDYANFEKVYDEIARIRGLIKDGTIIGDKKALEEQLVNYEALLEKAEELAVKQAETLTGSTYDSVVDSLASAFDDGVYSAEEFAKTFEQLMQKAMLNALKINTLKEPLDKWYKEFASLSNGGLTEAEIAKLRESYNTIANNAAMAFEEMKKITGISFDDMKSGAGGLSGAIKGMSQESADLLAGQLGAMRIHLADIASVVTGGFNSDLRLDTADMEQSFGLGLNAINNAILQSNDYLRQIVQNTASIEEMKSILANGITIKNRGFGDSFFDRRITGR